MTFSGSGVIASSSTVSVSVVFVRVCSVISLLRLLCCGASAGQLPCLARFEMPPQCRLTAKTGFKIAEKWDKLRFFGVFGRILRCFIGRRAWRHRDGRRGRDVLPDLGETRGETRRWLIRLWRWSFMIPCCNRGLTGMWVSCGGWKMVAWGAFGVILVWKSGPGGALVERKYLCRTLTTT